MTPGVEDISGAKPGISLFLFLFRPLFCSLPFPALEDAILVSEAAGDQVSGLVFLIVRKWCLVACALGFVRMLWVFRCMLTIRFSIFYPFLGFLLSSCVGGNEMALLHPVIVQATAKHTASVSFVSVYKL